MMIIMQTDATKEQISTVVERVEVYGLRAHLSQGEERTVIGVVGDGRILDQEDEDWDHRQMSQSKNCPRCPPELKIQCC